MSNSQAASAGKNADEIIKQLANPGQPIESKHASTDVLDQVTPVANKQQHDWETRFNNYKASTDKTLYALRQQAKEFELVSRENAVLKETQQKVESQPNELLELFSKEEAQGIDKRVDSKVENLERAVQRQEQELQAIRAAEETAMRNEAHNSVVRAVSNAVPHYEEIDSDPAFKQWMEQPDIFGNIRYDLLMRAKNSPQPDLSRIVQFYLEFEREVARRQQPQEERFTQQELLQTPSSSSSSASPKRQQRSTRRWDTASISQFYKDKAIGKISPARAAEIEPEIYAAIRGGS